MTPVTIICILGIIKLDTQIIQLILQRSNNWEVLKISFELRKWSSRTHIPKRHTLLTLKQWFKSDVKNWEVSETCISIKRSNFSLASVVLQVLQIRESCQRTLQKHPLVQNSLIVSYGIMTFIIILKCV